jgi:hypothetical protein
MVSLYTSFSFLKGVLQKKRRKSGNRKRELGRFRRSWKLFRRVRIMFNLPKQL